MIISSWMRFAAPADIVIHSELRMPFCIVANELRLNDRAWKIHRQRRHTHTRSAFRNTPGSARERSSRSDPRSIQTLLIGHIVVGNGRLSADRTNSRFVRRGGHGARVVHPPEASSHLIAKWPWPSCNPSAWHLYEAIGVKAVAKGHLLVRLAGDISSSRPDFPADAARSGRQGWPKAIAQRLALDGREHSVKLPQSGDTGVSRSFSSVSATATIPRGARHRARVARHELVFGRPRRSHHDAVMRIGGEAPRGGPILNRGVKAIVHVGLPPPRAVVYRSGTVVTLACSNSVVVTLPGEAADPPALRQSW